MDDYDEEFEDGFEEGFEENNEEFDDFDDEDDDIYDEEDEDDEDDDEVDEEEDDEDDGEEDLDDYARYSRFPFDIFVLERWNHSKPPEEDYQQWRSLAAEFLSLSPEMRKHYKELSSVDDDRRISNQLLTPHNVSRVLVPHQTVRERNICCNASLSNPIWVRTCFDPALDESYYQLKGRSDVGDTSCEEEMVLEDSVYDAAPSYDKDLTVNILMTRLPSLGDVFDNDHHTTHVRPGADAVAVASCEARVIVFLADRKAIEEDHVRVLWLTSSGKCVWDGRIKPDHIAAVCGLLKDGHCLSEIVDEKWFEPPTKLDDPNFRIYPRL